MCMVITPAGWPHPRGILGGGEDGAGFPRGTSRGRSAAALGVKAAEAHQNIFDLGARHQVEQPVIGGPLRALWGSSGALARIARPVAQRDRRNPGNQSLVAEQSRLGFKPLSRAGRRICTGCRHGMRRYHAALGLAHCGEGLQILRSLAGLARTALIAARLPGANRVSHEPRQSAGRRSARSPDAQSQVAVLARHSSPRGHNAPNRTALTGHAPAAPCCPPSGPAHARPFW